MSKLKFTLICPAPEAFRVTRQRPRPPKRMRIFRFCMLGPLCVAASAPDYVETTIVDENVEPLDLDCDTDVVGVSFMTFNAPRAYEIGDAFRARGKTVFFGGYHPTLMPEEAIRHCDAICIGDAEANLPRMFDDLRDGRLKQFYAERAPELARKPVDTGLIRRKDYATSSVVQATRGCNMRCEFCSVTAFYEHTLRCRPLADVLEQIAASPGRDLLFMDDNIAADSRYAKALFRAMAPLKKRWFSQVPVSVARDAEMLRLMKESGCRAVFVGLESLSQESLAEAAKGFNRAEEYRAAVRRFHAHGIGVIGAFVVGFDHDTPEVFARTTAFLREANVDVLQLTILTPFPGTPLHHRMTAAGRMVDVDWGHYDFGHVVFRPRNMTAGELQAGHDAVLAEFYSWRAILRRAARQALYLRPSQVLLGLVVGVGYRYKLRRAGHCLGPRPLAPNSRREATPWAEASH
jgi:radical SAM superfamily enzyme YgiQ (UPF0313 family)